MKSQENYGFRFFFLGVLLVLFIFLGLLLIDGENVEMSLAYLLVVLYLLWVGVREKYNYVLGIISTVAVVLTFFLSPDTATRNFTTFSIDFIVIFSVWIVIYFTHRQKLFLEKALKDQERLNALFENATEGILMISQSGEIMMVNKYAEQLFGYSREELKKEKIEKLIPERFSSTHKDHRAGYHKDPHNRPMGVGKELYALHKAGHEFPVEVSLGYYKTGEEVTVIAFVMDITERKKASEQLNEEKELTQKLNEKLEQRVEERTRDLEVALQELEETNQYLKQMEEELLQALEKERELGELKSRFVTTASHEFRTPLSTILSSVFLLENFTGDQYEISKGTHFKRIKRSVNNMTAILNDFLSLSKLEEGRIKASLEDTDIPACIQEIIDEMESIKKPGQTIHYSLSGSENTVLFDKQFLRNILINLISNAIKFSGANDKIDIISKVEHDQFKLQIVDQGIGIPEEDQRHLFKRFFRAHNVMNIEGTGLGLNIVKKYVELMQGNITFLSIPDKGTTFTITFPSTKYLPKAESNQLSEI